ncbi:glycoside hydrolase family 25 [Coriobacterium glomerans PW2]|uniref:Glycoside hydrolase family 25 n=1 Tax=Coriobacterium glomerans (strain ATCC 49209 / DSM 20642 / JCM 10262 / PW2) TaxID=700015 RepID=F2N845_CORGP|nr:glycoside hydrolase family 25 protein [Coriobacterium glomerans]AEB07228.1 glycoside hydrolase family 25 [Coriobacterium glomerans PW2]
MHKRRMITALLFFAVLLLGQSSLSSPVFAEVIQDQNQSPTAEEAPSHDEVSIKREADRDRCSGGYLNSFRYVDGRLIQRDNGSSYSASKLNTWRKENGVYISTDGTRVENAKAFGLDVSQWQGTIDWRKVASSGLVDYAIIRCGIGSDVLNQDDQQFLNNVRGCQQNSIPFGVYIYSYAFNTSMAQSEAQHVLRLLKAAGLSSSASVEYPIYLDLENDAKKGRPAGEDNGQVVYISNATLEKISDTFCSSIEKAGFSAGVYANLNWWNNYLTGSIYNRWSKWVAQYNTACTYHSQHDMWQCMSDGSITGINGAVDIDFDFIGLNPATPPDKNHQTMYRLYNPNSSEHFYTLNSNERNSLSRIGWIYEGVAWFAPFNSNRPVYRLFNPSDSDHHYTLSINERDTLVRIGWVYEGICWYSDSESTSTVYRLFNPNCAYAGAHHYTLSENERNVLVRLGWIYEGPAWHGLNK